MKWGRKKPASSVSSSRFPSLPHVFPTSWSSMFKRMSINTATKPAEEKSVGKQNDIHTSSLIYGGAGVGAGVEDGGRFYSGDDDAFWRLSFHQDSVDGKTSRKVLKSVWYDSDNELNLPSSSCQICGSNVSREREKEGTEKFSRTAWDVKLMNEIHRDAEIFADKETYKKEKAMIIKTPRLMDEEYLTTKKSTERVMERKKFRTERNTGGAEGMPTRSVGKSNLELESSRAAPIIEMENLKLRGKNLRKYQQFSYGNQGCSDSITAEENLFSGCKLGENDELPPNCLSSQRKILKEMKIKQLTEKSEKQRKSTHISRELERRRTKQKSKVKVFSPRTVARVEICKIRALEDMKKAKLKTRAAKVRTVKERTGLQNLAMVKFSFDPEKDFRDSMIEMIVEKRISQSEELEALLACYLTLNSDEYHDLIIKVFREVWTKLDQASFDFEFLKEQCLHDLLLSNSQ